jgi:hypothetical protein
MKVGKQAVNFSSAFLLFALSACSTTTVSQDSTEITAITDNRPNASVERSVGKLRRLAIAPVGYKVIEGSFVALFGGTTNENNFKKALLSETMSLLNDWKGYEAVPIDLYEDVLREKLNPSDEQIQKHMDVLADWAKESTNGEDPPEEIADLVSRIGLALNVDGLLFIQGFNKPPNYTMALTILTASLAWPLLSLEADNELRADIYEVSSGKIVWSRKVSITPILLDQPTQYEIANPKHWARLLFEPLEYAIPKVLVEKNP